VRRQELARRRFTEHINSPEDRIDVAEAALWIAAEAVPHLNVEGYLDALDRLARGALRSVEAASGERERIAALNRYLFVERGFCGNRDDYNDPRNSYLNDVLDRRTGIPITLSLVYVEVAQRLGFHATGVAFPGHFLAKVVGSEEIVVDAFEGRVVDAEECGERLRAALGPDAHFDRSWLRAARPKEVLARMLRNLKQIHLARDEWDDALACCDRTLLIDPDDPLELRDRGLVYAELECFRAAADDLERFLALAPGHQSAAEMRRTLEPLRQRARELH
jgi:regulator of sirC expression with transglutaminase-like and TPR domain